MRIVLIQTLEKTFDSPTEDALLGGSKMADLHSALSYYIETVIPRYEALVAQLQDDCIGRKRDLYAVGAAAEACLHLADYVCRDPTCNARIPGAPRSGAYVEVLTEKYLWFAIARDVANVCKHRSIKRAGRKLETLEALDERLTVVRHEDGQGFFYVAEKNVLVHLLDGRIFHAEDVIRGCIADWAADLKALGVVAQHPFAVVRNWVAERSDFPERPTMKLTMQADVEMQCRPALRVYDPSIAKPRRRGLDEEFVTAVDVDWEVLTGRFEVPGDPQRGRFSLSVNFPPGVAEDPSAV